MTCVSRQTAHLKDKSSKIMGGGIQESLRHPLSPPWFALSLPVTWPGTAARMNPEVWNIQALLSHVCMSQPLLLVPNTCPGSLPIPSRCSQRGSPALSLLVTFDWTEITESALLITHSHSWNNPLILSCHQPPGWELRTQFWELPTRLKHAATHCLHGQSRHRLVGF